MALTHERNKSARTRRGCILCYNMGAAAPTFAYVLINYVPMYVKGEVKPVQKEVGLCFKHCSRKTENNPSGILDKDFGPWKKTPFGYMPERDGLFQLVGGPDNTQMVTGTHGKLPLWW